MPLGKPDVTKFDSDDDSIKDARPEIQTAFTSLNTMIDEYTANGDTFGGGGSIHPTKRRDVDCSLTNQQIQLENGFSHVIAIDDTTGNTLDLATQNFDVNNEYYITLFAKNVLPAIDTTVNIYANNDYTGAISTGIQIGDAISNYFFLKMVKIQINDDSAGGEYTVYAQTDTYNFKYDI